MMAENDSPKQTVDKSPEVLDLRRERRAQQRAHDDHIHDLMRAPVKRSRTARRIPARPSSDLL
ncbi:MAG: hypothetical protein QOF68_2495 [Gaiellales bacterium]|nr:hypothetical protein [Gaiellales bacterium]